ncbi:lipase B [Penicillium antarcticum]|uniref:lipase B n=1 Tax=Penicillium antarcticum TaxID=416450 RepID=UPI0023A1F02A|nr:lipase B [Penicillium antarcticum]KAJ5312282.1 lipase B [Penicillium antarcticum]
MKSVLVFSWIYGVLGSPLTAGQSSALAKTTLLNPLSSANNSDIAESTSVTLTSIVSHLDQADALTTPQSPESALSAIQNIISKGSPSIYDVGRGIAEAGLLPSDVISVLDGYLDSAIHSLTNQNTASVQNIYPKAAGDAPYSVPEDTLRAAIHIPDSFSFGRGRAPVILVPGTGIPAGMTFHFNFAKLGDSIPIDAVWVNLPRASLSDAQVNTEYIAYTINYIATLCGDRVAVLSWSQGGLNTQWALKYWPPTRAVVKDFIAISPGFHGTLVRSLVCPSLDLVLCTPSLWQQGWETEYIHTLRSDGGDSAYVPTTTVYSTFDEIVQPMSGPNASAILGDERRVGVTNVHLQSACTTMPAGGVYTHEGAYNPLAWALAIDASLHDGPADLSRVNLAQVCQQVLAPALDMKDLFGTEGLLLVAVAELVLYKPHALGEPPIVDYAS